MRILISNPSAMVPAIAAVNRGEISEVLPRPFTVNTMLEAVESTLDHRRQMMEVARVQQAAARIEELRMLDECFSENHIQIALQPILCSQSRQLIAFEALLRSTHPVLSGPLSVLRAADHHDRIDAVADIVFRRTAAWLRQLPRSVSLFINLHPDELSEPDRLTRRLQLLSEDASRVVLEITERSRLQSIYGWEESLKRAKEMGFSVAVDDLGSGYSSLSMLADLQPQYIKMDMSIVRGVDASSRKKRMVNMLCRFAEATGSQLIAEGVETAEEAEALTSAGTHLLQGYLFGRPSQSPSEILDHVMRKPTLG
jgi:EAL domain-containing protein (putative c-di-GMP-specific phosphodiesterase class I)